MTEPTGRRERKKAQTRRSLAEAALELFLDRGFEHVGVRDVAEAADVSVTTLFKHFPSKEALVFDQDDDIEAALVAAVRERPSGQTIPQALRDHLRLRKARAEDPSFRLFNRLVEDTPPLRDYARRMWTRHEEAVACAIADEVGASQDDVTCVALARFALEAPYLIHGHAEPERATDEVFALLERGWEAVDPAGDRA